MINTGNVGRQTDRYSLGLENKAWLGYQHKVTAPFPLNRRDCFMRTHPDLSPELPSMSHCLIVEHSKLSWLQATIRCDCWYSLGPTDWFCWPLLWPGSSVPYGVTSHWGSMACSCRGDNVPKEGWKQSLMLQSIHQGTSQGQCSYSCCSPSIKGHHKTTHIQERTILPPNGRNRNVTFQRSAETRCDHSQHHKCLSQSPVFVMSTSPHHSQWIPCFPKEGMPRFGGLGGPGSEQGLKEGRWWELWAELSHSEPNGLLNPHTVLPIVWITYPEDTMTQPHRLVTCPRGSQKVLGRDQRPS